MKSSITEIKTLSNKCIKKIGQKVLKQRLGRICKVPKSFDLAFRTEKIKTKCKSIGL